MKLFGEAQIKPDVPDTTDVPKADMERPHESESWQNSIELPDYTDGADDSSELTVDNGEWIHNIVLVDDFENSESVIISDDGSSELSDTTVSESTNNEISEKIYFDDNGIPYRTGDSLLPNNEYEINQYKYVTDNQGRIISAEGTLRIKEREGRLPIKDSIESIGKGDQLENDDRGHLIGDQFDGSNGLENMIPQDACINRNGYKQLENELAKAVKCGSEVYMKVEPIYESDSRRPSKLVVTYSIDGDESMVIFPNSQEE